MLYYFTEISKYIITALMCLYILECIKYEIKKEDYLECDGIVVRQRIYMLLIQAVSYMTVVLRTGELDYLFLCFFVQIILFATMTLSSLIYPCVDKILLNNMALLLSIGFIILSRLDFDKAIKQFFIVTVSIVIGMFIPYIIKKMPDIQYFDWIYAAVGAGMLLVVLVLGKATYGSKITYSIGGITFQPSEIVKIIFIFAMAAMLSKAKRFTDVLITTLVAATHVLILVFCKDLGSALVFFIAYLFMLFIATRSYVYLVMGLLAGGVCAVAGYQLFAHVRVRVQAFLDPFSVIESAGYQISQSLFAISCGSYFGMGLTKGLPKDIPFVATDFVFSAIAEEMGVVFAIGVLLVCFSSFVIMMKAGICKISKFYRLLVIGCAVMYIFQVFLTVGGGTKFIPLTGVTLPFISYGGTSVLTSIVLFYIAQSVIILIRDDELQGC